eukprot:5527324-Amphidinium_carterae.2
MDNCLHQRPSSRVFLLPDPCPTMVGSNYLNLFTLQIRQKRHLRQHPRRHTSEECLKSISVVHCFNAAAHVWGHSVPEVPEGAQLRLLRMLLAAGAQSGARWRSDDAMLVEDRTPP